jgi:hypothetical protein
LQPTVCASLADQQLGAAVFDVAIKVRAKVQGLPDSLDQMASTNE